MGACPPLASTASVTVEPSMSQDWRSRAKAQRREFREWTKRKLAERLAAPGDSPCRRDKLRYIVQCKSEQYEKALWRDATSKKDYTGRVKTNLKGLEADVLRALDVALHGTTPAQHNARIKPQEAQHASSAHRASGSPSGSARKTPGTAGGDVGYACQGQPTCRVATEVARRRRAARARDSQRGLRAAWAWAGRDRVEQRRSRRCVQRLATVPEGDEPLELLGNCELVGVGVTVGSTCHVPTFDLLGTWLDAGNCNAPPSPSSPTSCFEEAAAAFSKRFQCWVQGLFD